MDDDTPTTDEQRKASYADEVEAELIKLHEYREALKQEFEKATDDEDVSHITRKQIIELIPDAAETVAFLLKHSDSDAVRANLSKFILETGIKTAKGEDEASEMAKLVAKLTGKKEEKAEAETS